MTRLQHEMQRMADANSRIEGLEEEIARLRAALKPFAEFAKVFVGRADRGGHKDDAAIAGANDATLTVGDCRAALKALEGE